MTQPWLDLKCHGLNVKHGFRAEETRTLEMGSEAVLEVELSSDEDLHTVAQIRIRKRDQIPGDLAKGQMEENIEACRGDWHIGGTRSRDRDACPLSRPELPHM